MCKVLLIARVYAKLNCMSLVYMAQNKKLLLSFYFTCLWVSFWRRSMNERNSEWMKRMNPTNLQHKWNKRLSINTNRNKSKKRFCYLQYFSASNFQTSYLLYSSIHPSKDNSNKACEWMSNILINIRSRHHSETPRWLINRFSQSNKSFETNQNKTKQSN